MSAVLSKLGELGGQKHTLLPWVEVILEQDAYNPEAAQTIQDAAQELPIALLRIVARYPGNAPDLSETLPEKDLQDLSPKEVFKERCVGAGIPEKEQQGLLQTFDELLNWMNENNSR